MNYLLGVILAAAGIGVLIWNRSLSNRFAHFSAHRYSMTFGRLAHALGWDDPTKSSNVLLYRTLVILLGRFLLIMSFHSFFGTIYIGAAAQPPDSILQAHN